MYLLKKYSYEEHDDLHCYHCQSLQSLHIIANETRVGLPKHSLLWMEEILHQLVYGLSHCNPIIYSVL